MTNDTTTATANGTNGVHANGANGKTANGGTTNAFGTFSPPVANTAIGAQFERDGFYLARGVFSPSELETLESDFDKIVRQLNSSGEHTDSTWGGAEVQRLKGGEERKILHTHNVQQYSSAWMMALLHPKCLGIAKEILGEDVILHHTKLFQKLPEKGSPFPMHQDWTYFPTYEDSMIAGIIHVSKATDEMGCIRVYPGSHRLGKVPGTSGQEVNPTLEKYKIEGATVVEAQPGDVLFFHYFLLHGSMPNRSDTERKTVLMQLHSGRDAVVEGCEHPDERLVLSGFNYRAKRSNVNGH